MNAGITPYEKDLIKALRKEAQDIKDCYTKFSFQAIAFSATVLGVIARFQPQYPYVALSSIATIIVLITVSRIGVYKYTGANRMYGYELHLFRTRSLQESAGNGWKSEMRMIGWEEAMRSWRIVQATIFREIYITKFLIPKIMKKKYREKPNNSDYYRWFDIEDLAEPEADYHPGTYLGTMNSILYLLSGLSTIPLFFLAYQINQYSFLTLEYFLALSSLLVVIYFYIRERFRRKILESELHSIHSCSITWHGVVVAHYRALKLSDGYKGYTKKLVGQAKDIVRNIEDIHKWVYDSTVDSTVNDLTPNGNTGGEMRE